MFLHYLYWVLLIVQHFGQHLRCLYVLNKMTFFGHCRHCSNIVLIFDIHKLIDKYFHNLVNKEVKQTGFLAVTNIPVYRNNSCHKTPTHWTVFTAATLCYVELTGHQASCMWIVWWYWTCCCCCYYYDYNTDGSFSSVICFCGLWPWLSHDDMTHHTKTRLCCHNSTRFSSLLESQIVLQFSFSLLWLRFFLYLEKLTQQINKEFSQSWCQIIRFFYRKTDRTWSGFHIVIKL